MTLNEPPPVVVNLGRLYADSYSAERPRNIVCTSTVGSVRAIRSITQSARDYRGCLIFTGDSRGRLGFRQKDLSLLAIVDFKWNYYETIKNI